MDSDPPQIACGLFSNENRDRQAQSLKQKLGEQASFDLRREIDQILDEVARLNDKDKVLLYLRLPAGQKVQRGTANIDNVDMLKTGQVQRLKVEAQQWLRANYVYEESQTCSVGRQEVYDHYRRCCELASVKALNQQDFGKVVKHVFCSVTYRRLGNRSNSKFHYAGIRRTSLYQPPRLCPLDLFISDRAAISLSRAGRIETEVKETSKLQAAQRIVLKYVNEMLALCFNNLVDAAKHLLVHHYVQGDSSDASILECDSSNFRTANHREQQWTPKSDLCINGIRPDSRAISEPIPHAVPSQRKTRSSSAPMPDLSNSSTSVLRPASLPATKELFKRNGRGRQVCHTRIRHQSRKSNGRHPSSNSTGTSSHAQPFVEASVHVTSDCHSASHSDEQRRHKFTDTLQEIAQERGVVADKTMTSVAVSRTPSAVGDSGMSSRKRRRTRPPNIDLSKASLLYPSLETRNASAPMQSCVGPDPTSVTVVNSLPLDPSKYAFMPISMSLSPLQCSSGKIASLGSPINELRRMTSRLPDAPGTVPQSGHSQSSAACTASVQASARTVTLVQRSPYQCTPATIVNTENARDSEGFVQPSCGSKDWRLKLQTSTPSLGQAASTLVPFGRAPPPSYAEAVARMTERMPSDVCGACIPNTPSFPAMSITNDNVTAGMDSFFDDTAQMYSTTAVDGLNLSRRCRTGQFVGSLHRETVNSFAGHACLVTSPLNCSEGQTLNGSAFRQVPPSSHSTPAVPCSSHLDCVPVTSSDCLPQPEDITSSTDLLSPLTLFSSFTDDNEEGTSQDCGGNTSSLSSVADDIPPWGVDGHWQF